MRRRTIITGLLILGCMFGQQKNKPLNKDERLDVFDMMGTFEELSRKSQEVAAKIAETALGKQQVELQKQMQDLSNKYVETVKALGESHGAKGCGLSRTLEWTGCPADEPAKKAADKK